MLVEGEERAPDSPSSKSGASSRARAALLSRTDLFHGSGKSIAGSRASLLSNMTLYLGRIELKGIKEGGNGGVTPARARSMGGEERRAALAAPPPSDLF